MKVTVSDNQSQQEKEIKFPVLMEGITGSIVLFLNETTGITVQSSVNNGKVGHYSELYCKFNDRNCWKPLPNGVKVTLENDL